MKPTDPFILADALRRVQGAALALAGLGQAEFSYRFIVSGLGWRLRAYLGPESGPAVLIASAPIKRPYIWDLAPSMSAVRICVQHGLRVFLVEWTPSDAEDGPGLGECADAIGESVARVASVVGGMRPFLMGHSLGGTLAAIYAAFEPDKSGVWFYSVHLSAFGAAQARSGMLSFRSFQACRPVPTPCPARSFRS